MPTEDMRTLVVETVNSVMEVKIPSTWKVTFSRVNPQNRAGNDPYCLRFYEGGKAESGNQRGLIPHVVAFYDKAMAPKRTPSRRRITSGDLPTKKDLQNLRKELRKDLQQELHKKLHEELTALSELAAAEVEIAPELDREDVALKLLEQYANQQQWDEDEAGPEEPEEVELDVGLPTGWKESMAAKRYKLEDSDEMPF